MSYTQHPIAAGSFRLEKNSFKDFYNAVSVEYAKNYNSEEFTATLSDSDLTSISNYGVTKTKYLDHPFTKDSATAGYFADNELELHSNLFFYCEVDSFLNAANKEIGDLINIRNTILNGLLGSAVYDTYAWQILDISYDPFSRAGLVKIRAWGRGEL